MCTSFKLSNLFWLFIGTYFPSLIGTNEHYAKFFPVSEVLSTLIEESGYFHIQATKPDTIGTYTILFRIFKTLNKIYKLLEIKIFNINKTCSSGAALTASPDALAAYILEKFSVWTNKTYKKQDDGGITEKFMLDELLDNIMIYWITNSITTSVRLYAENYSSSYRSLKIEQ